MLEFAEDLGFRGPLGTDLDRDQTMAKGDLFRQIDPSKRPSAQFGQDGEASHGLAAIWPGDLGGRGDVRLGFEIVMYGDQAAQRVLEARKPPAIALTINSFTRLDLLAEPLVSKVQNH